MCGTFFENFTENSMGKTNFLMYEGSRKRTLTIDMFCILYGIPELAGDNIIIF